MIETLTYSCQDTEMLTAVNTELQTLYDKIKSAILQVEGLQGRRTRGARGAIAPPLSKMGGAVPPHILSTIIPIIID